MSVNIQPPKSTSDRCKSCNQTLRAGEIVCPACGLPTTVTGKTHKMSGTHGLHGDKSWSLDLRNIANATVMLEIGDRAIQFPVSERFVIGRASADYMPDIDLTLFDATDKGVSRQHVEVKREMLIYITDLGSTNGTFLNGQRLFVNSEYVINDGDELQIGYLKARVRFQWL